MKMDAAALAASALAGVNVSLETQIIGKINLCSDSISLKNLDERVVSNYHLLLVFHFRLVFRPQNSLLSKLPVNPRYLHGMFIWI